MTTNAINTGKINQQQMMNSNKYGASTPKEGIALDINVIRPRDFRKNRRMGGS